MTSAVPPRGLTDIHWPDFAEGSPARWLPSCRWRPPNSNGPHLPVGTDVMIAQAYLARVLELLPDNLPATFCRSSRSGFPSNILVIPAR